MVAVATTVVEALVVLLVEILAQAGVLLPVEALGVVVLAGVVEARLLLTLVVPAQAAIQVAPGEAPIAVAPAAILVRSVVVIPVVEAPALTGDSNT